MNKEALLRSVTEMREDWERTLKELGPNGLEQPAAHGDWRVRDVLAHFNGWERWQLVQLRSTFTGVPPTEEELTGGIRYPANDDMSEDAMNAMFIEGNRTRATAQVVDDWREISQMRGEWVAGASQEQLDAIIGDDWPGYPRVFRLASEVPSVTNTLRVWERIADQVGHQRIHYDAVREWIRS